MATTWSTPPVRLAEWFWPRIFGDPMLAESLLYLGYPGVDRPVPLILSIYCGALIIALAIGGLLDRDLPHRRGLIAMILVGIFLSLGRYNPVYSAILVQIPPFSLIRFPEKFLLLSTSGFAIAASLAWHKLLLARREGHPQPALRVSLTVGVVALTVGAILYVTPLIAPDLTVQLLEGATADKLQWYDQSDGSSAIPDRALAARAGYLGRETFVNVVFWLSTLAVLVMVTRTRVPQALLILLALGLSTTELAYYSRTVNNTVPAEVLMSPPEALDALPPSTGRVFSDAILYGDTEFLIPDPGSEVPASLRRFLQRLDPYSATLWGYGYALEPDTDLMLIRWGRHSLDLLTSSSGLMTQGWNERVYRFLGAWNIGIVVRRRSPAAQMEEKRRTGSQPEPVRLLVNPHTLPKLRFMARVHFAPHLGSAVESISDRDFRLADFDAMVAPQVSTDTSSVAFDPRVELLSTSDSGGALDIEYQSENRSFLVVAATADRDWRALVDGSATPIHWTALGQMGVELPAGRHHLSMRHRNPALLPGALITLVSILGCALFLRPRRIRS